MKERGTQFHQAAGLEALDPAETGIEMPSRPSTMFDGDKIVQVNNPQEARRGTILLHTSTNI